MKAAQIKQYGDASAVAIKQEVPRPTAGGGKVLASVTIFPVSRSAGIVRYRLRGSARWTMSLRTSTSSEVAAAAPGMRTSTIKERLSGPRELEIRTLYPAFKASRAMAVPARPAPRMPRTVPFLLTCELNGMQHTRVSTARDCRKLEDQEKSCDRRCNSDQGRVETYQSSLSAVL